MSSLSPPANTRRPRSPSPRAHPFVRAYSPQPPVGRAGNDEDSDNDAIPLPSPLATPRKGGPVPTAAGSRMSLECRRSVLGGAPRLPLPALLATPPSQALPLPPAVTSGRPAPASLPRMWTRQPNDSTSRLTPVSPARGAPSRSPPPSPTAPSVRLPGAPPTASPSAPPSPTPLPRDERGQARTLGHSRSMYLRKCARTGRPRSASFVIPSPTGDAPRPKPWLEDGPGSRSPSPASSRSSSRTGGWVTVSKTDSGRSTPLKDLFSPLPASDADDPAEEDLTDRLPTLPLDPSFGAGADPRNPAMSLGRKRGLFLGGLLLKKKSSLPAMRALVVSPLKAAETRHEAPTWITADDLDRAGPRSTRSTSQHSSPPPPPPPPTAKSFFASIKRSASQSSFTKRALETLHRRNSSASSTSSTRSYASSRAERRSSRALAAAEAASRPSHESLAPSLSSTTSSSTVRPMEKVTLGGSAFTTPPALTDPPGWLASNWASPASSASSHAPATTPVSLPRAALPLVRASTPTDHHALRTQATATSAKKLQQVLGVEAAGDAERALMPSFLQASPPRATRPEASSQGRQPGADDFGHRLAVSLLASASRIDVRPDRRHQSLPPLPTGSVGAHAVDDDDDDASVEVSVAPPRLDVRRETVDFSRTLLRLSAVDYNWDDQDVAEEEPSPVVESRPTLKPRPSVVTSTSALAQLSSSASPLLSDDSLTPTARKPQWSPRTSALFSLELVTPAHDRLGSSLQLASSFPLPPPMPQPAPPTRKRSTLVSRRQSSSRQLGRSQSYKRPVLAPISSARGAGPSSLAQSQPTSPILGRQRSLKRRTSARRTVKKQKSASNLKGTVKWGTRSAPVVVADSTSEGLASSTTLPPSSFSRHVISRALPSFASTTGSVGHDETAASGAQDPKRTTVLDLDARSATPLPNL